jgi:hypothetical protein
MDPTQETLPSRPRKRDISREFSLPSMNAPLDENRPFSLSTPEGSVWDVRRRRKNRDVSVKAAPSFLLAPFRYDVVIMDMQRVSSNTSEQEWT